MSIGTTEWNRGSYLMCCIIKISLQDLEIILWSCGWTNYVIRAKKLASQELSCLEDDSERYENVKMDVLVGEIILE